MEKIIYNKLSELGYPVFPVMAPQNEKNPVIIYNTITNIKRFGLLYDSKLDHGFYQLDIYADTYIQMKDIETEVLIKIKEIKDLVIIDYQNSHAKDDGYRSKINLSINYKGV